MHFPNASINHQIRRIFYAILPSESSFQNVSDVPDYLNEAIPFFLAAVLVEYFAALLKGNPTFRLNDGLSSIGAGLLSQLSKIIVLVSELVLYVHIHERYCIMLLPWDSPWTWLFCFTMVDFIYYWFHRATHEVNILWGAHQVHHSSEDYNLSTALRQSIVQNYTSWIFYCPLALVAPPSIFYVHYQLNTLYQFWIHTEMIESLGPLEYILNTPSHHRVHHGRNPYCIDKNYGGTLIIWDRIFGTFQAEKEEQVVYGLVHPLASWDPLHTQLCHYEYVFGAFWKMEGFRNKLSLLFKGPGWTPGSPRLGNPDCIPEIEYPVEKYDKNVSYKLQAYILIHSALLMVAFQELAVKKFELSIPFIWTVGIFFLLTVTCISSIVEEKNYAAVLETFRCLTLTIIHSVASASNLDLTVVPGHILPVATTIYAISSIFWMSVAWQEREGKAKSY